ncbi:hypothetical protein MLD38_006085 [Melastoma candidum]|uniref:Uncharacterized protein n=1 Tax=Melastoma candidum TaxID=119954 RepID=A0ACB9RNQ2_9MYRT|nr:hypothetical protein MLD38_006085 [Melastoma candidum]
MTLPSLLLLSSSPSSLIPFSSIFISPTTSSFRRLTLMASSSSSSSASLPTVYPIPCLYPEEVDRVSRASMERYSCPLDARSRTGRGTVIVWFRNDLRVIDNEVLYEAWIRSEAVLPVYCVDPRHFGSTRHFRFPKTGALRARFLVECLDDLKKNLVTRGLDLLIRHGKPEELLPSIAEAFGAHTVYAQKETCSEEVNVENLVKKCLQRLKVGSSPGHSVIPKLHLLWGSTMYHIDDLPFKVNSLPDVYTQFRKTVESKCKVRTCIKTPRSLGPPPKVGDWGCVPSVEQLGLNQQKVDKGIRCLGGESAALSRVEEYFWMKDLLRTYKVTRNGMLGTDYSTKFSMWLATGCISSRFIHEEVLRYEKERVANESTYWVLFELIWRDYFRFLSMKYGNSIFHLGGPRNVQNKWSQDQKLFECWKEGRTGYPLIDANMKELSATGFMSNRGRQIVCSFLVRDMGLDWRMGAEWFESCLLDYDPCSNYGNWTYGAGVGNDPREDRYFSIPKQAQTYDPEGEYVAFWLPQLRPLPISSRHFPGSSYIPQVVPLKFGNAQKARTIQTGRRGNPVERQTRGSSWKRRN